MKGAAIGLLLATACTFQGAPGQPADAGGDGGVDASVDGPDRLPRGNRVSCDPLPALTSGQADHTVTTASELEAVVPLLEDNEVVSIAPGVYELGARLEVVANGVTIRGATGDPDDVIIRGLPDNSLFDLFAVRGSDVTLAAMTLANGSRLVRVQPSVIDASGVRLFDLTVIDFVETGIEISNSGGATTSDGVLACSRITSTLASACDGFLLGVDLRGPNDNWRITENTVGPACLQPVSAVHMGIRVSRGNRGAVIDHNRVSNFEIGIQAGEIAPAVPACDGQDGVGWDSYRTLVCENSFTYDDPLTATSAKQGIFFRNSCSSIAAYNTIGWVSGPNLGLRFDGPGSVVDHANNVVTSTIGGTQSPPPLHDGPELGGLTAADFRSFPTDLRLVVEPTTATDLANDALVEEFCSWDLDGFEREPSNPGFGAYAPTGSRIPGE